MTIIVTDRFDLNNEGRMGGNGRRYVLHAVKQMIESPETQEGLRLGELVGYWGHSRRELAKKLKLAEVEVVTIDGKPVVMENVPSNRTVAIELDSNTGIIEHTEEVFDTPPGLLVQSMLASNYGGWSWATGGPNSAALGARPRKFYGFDFVKQPNFVSKDKMQAMLESVDASESDIRARLEGHGFDPEGYQPLMESWGRLSEEAATVNDFEIDVMMLEGMLIEQKGANADLERDLEAARAELESAKQNRQQMILEALDAMPIMLTKEQRRAMVNMETPEDSMVFRALLESLSGMDTASLPLGQNRGAGTVKPSQSATKEPSSHAVSFLPPSTPFRR